MIAWLKDIPRQYRFAPRVDNTSLVLMDGPTGEAQVAKINDSLMKNAEVMVWQKSGSANRPITTGITANMLGYLGVGPGLAEPGRALVLNSSRDIDGIRNLGVSKVVADDSKFRNSEINVLVVNSNITTGQLKVSGLVASDLTLNTTYKIRSRRSAVDYEVFVRDGAVLRFGNTTDSLQLATGATTDLLHRKGTTNYKIWDAGNHGTGSGLDADLLDGKQASQFVRTDATSDITASLRFLDAIRIAHPSLPAGQDSWRLGNNGNLDFRIFSNLALKDVFTLKRDASAADFSVNVLRVNNNDVMHKGNDGAGSGFDADLLDGQHGSYYRQESSILGAMGTGALTRKSYVDGMFDVTIGTSYTAYEALDMYVTTRQFGKIVVVNARFRCTTQTAGKLVFTYWTGVPVPTRNVYCSSVTSRGGRCVFYVMASTRGVYLLQGNTGSNSGDIHAVTFTYIVN